MHLAIQLVELVDQEKQIVLRVQFMQVEVVAEDMNQTLLVDLVDREVDQVDQLLVDRDWETKRS